MSSNFKSWFTRKRVLALFLFYILMSVTAFFSCIDLYEQSQYQSKLLGAFQYIGFIYTLIFVVFWFIDVLFIEDDHGNN